MGKVVMPKNSALSNEIEAALKIYYEFDEWMPNDKFKEKLKKLIGDDQYPSSYTKKTQIPSYFGFIEWEDIGNVQSMRRITASGRRMYKAIADGDRENIQEILMESLEKTVFGRNNFGCPESDSDVEPPCLFIRALLETNYLTYREFALLLWEMEDEGYNYSDAIYEVKEIRRNKEQFELASGAEKYKDCKPITALIRWGFLSEDSTGGGNEKHIIVAPDVLSKYRKRLHNLVIYNIDKKIDGDSKRGDVMDNNHVNVRFHTKYEHSQKYKRNRIIFGAPGTGKSYKLNKQKDELLNEVGQYNCMRVTFHPEYSYSNFVGTYKPVPYKSSDGKNGVTYSFVPGPFLTLYTRALKNAQTDEPEPFLLIVEEINRANVAAVFGDIFQLLDRTDKNISEYPICPTEDIRKYLAEELNGLPDDFLQIRLPDNFYIWATMNSADQGVFPLDTAFKRRWDFTYVGINESDDKIRKKVVNVKNNGKDNPIHWNCLRKAINDYLAELGINEDKQLGPYFIGKDVVGADSDDCQIDDNKFSDAFKNKVIMYLFEDAARQKRKVVFSGCGEKAALRYSEICRKFDEKGIEIFSEEIRTKEDAYEAEFKTVNE